MSETLPKVYISVLNWNSYTKTSRCLKSLEQLKYNNHKIIVVDNASVDDSVIQLREQFPTVQIIESKVNLGYAGGNYLALDYALQNNAELLWILNNDTLVHPDALINLITAYIKRPYALYGSVPVYEDTERQEYRIASSQFLFTLNYKQKLFTLRRSITYKQAFPDTQEREVSALSGSSLLLPLHIVRKYGFMDTSFFLYAEETDYCYRLRKHKIPSILVPTSIVIHTRQGSSKDKPQLNAIIKYYQVRNLLIWTREYQTNTEYWMVLCKTLLRAVVWFAKSVAKGKNAFLTGKFILLGVSDAIRNRRGKTLSPEDYITQTDTKLNYGA